MKQRGFVWIAASAACGVFVLACSTTRPPTSKMAMAELAVRQATDSDAPRTAPIELRLAREKLDRAREAMRDEDYTRARRLAEEAVVDAELAQAKARSEKSRQTAEETRRSIEALRSEAERPTTPTPPY